MSGSGSSDRVAVHTNGHQPPLAANVEPSDAAVDADASAPAGTPRVNVKVTPIQAILGLVVFAWGIRLVLGRLRRGG